MPCYRPLPAYRAPGGKISLAVRDSYYNLHLEVPCGQCIGCRLEHSRQWAVRILHEAQTANSSCFITLTYDNEHLPENGSLNVRDWQLFAKRLRKRLGPFRFYHCGEYGDHTGRPHYHAAIFGHDFMSDRKLYKKVGDHSLYVSPTLEEIWGQGFCPIGSLTFDSAAYIARYITKKINGHIALYHYMRINYETGEIFYLKPEYSTMSRSHGIGHKWLTQYADQVYPRDEVIINSIKQQPPKYYDNLIARLDPEGIEKIKKKRKQKALSVQNQENSTIERLETRELVKELNSKTFAREPQRRST